MGDLAPFAYDTVIADLERRILELAATVVTLKRLRDEALAAVVAVPTPSDNARLDEEYFNRINRHPLRIVDVFLREGP